MGGKVSSMRKKKFGYFFDFADLDKDGYMTANDYKNNVLNLQKEFNLGLNGVKSFKQIMASWWVIFKKDAKKHGGLLDKKTFLRRITMYQASGDRTLPVRTHFKALFRLIDQDGDKAISFEEFLAYYRAHNWTDEEQVRQIFSQLDTDNDGTLNEEEFVFSNTCFFLSDKPETSYAFLYKRKLA